VLPVKGARGTTYMFMGDRWSYPRQASAATYVWQPLTVTGTTLTMPRYQPAWRIDAASGTIAPGPATGNVLTPDDAQVRFTGTWAKMAGDRVSDDRRASVSVTFTGTQASLYGVARPDGGYARITLRDRGGRQRLSSMVDMYSKYPVSDVRFVTPILPAGTYTLTAEVVGDGWYWINKRGDRSGSAGSAISFERLEVRR
jgi:hypothetical protein